MNQKERILLNGNEAVAHAALVAGVNLGTGYPGTPSTEILETFSAIGGKAQWAPNEKVALEVGIGVVFAQGRAIVTMKHVGLNVAADPLFTISYIGSRGGLVIVVADDPGMASSQNEQDSRRYAIAAGIPMFEPSDSQEAYSLLLAAFELSEAQEVPVLFRMTTRVCHSKSIVEIDPKKLAPKIGHYVKDIKQNVMIPAFARPAHKRLRAKLNEIQKISAKYCFERAGEDELGLIVSGISALHAMEAAPQAKILKLSLTYPLPSEKIRQFANSVKRCIVIEEGDPILAESCLAAGIQVESKDEMYRFGELNVERVKRIIAKDTSAEVKPNTGTPPQLCQGCPHRVSFEALRDLGCIVTGDIGCYTLGVLPPFSAMDTCVCMGASITVGLGMRHTLPADEARKVVSVLGDSTFMHSGLTGLVEMVYNPPKTGHVVLVLDNDTTAMTGLQEHPGTGRALDHSTTSRVSIEAVAKAIGIKRIKIVDPFKQRVEFKNILAQELESNELSLIIARQPCILHRKRMNKKSK